MAFKAAAAVGLGLLIAEELAQLGEVRQQNVEAAAEIDESMRQLLAEAPTRAEGEAKLAALKAIPESLDGVADAVYGFADLAQGNILGSAIDGLFAANMLTLRAVLERRQVALVVATMPATRFDGATGRFLFGQLALAAQLQLDLDSERMASQCRAIFEAGGHRGLDPFGYRTVPGSRPRTLEPVEAKTEVVQRIWQELASRSTDEIADGLNRDDVRHRVERPWTRDAVKDIARRGRFYLGYVTHRARARGTSRTLPGHHRRGHMARWGGRDAATRLGRHPAFAPPPYLPARRSAPLRQLREAPSRPGRELSGQGVALLPLPGLLRRRGRG
jgi:DNA invertase Pin-like site-specific DNA recombinase